MARTRREEMEEARRYEVLARAIVKESARAEKERRRQEAAREYLRNRTPEQAARDAELARLRLARLAAEKEQARQFHGGSLDSWPVTLKEVGYKSFLYGGFVLTVFSYADIYRWAHTAGDAALRLPTWAGPFICACLYVARRLESQVKTIYADFDTHFPDWKFLLIFMFACPAVAFSGLFLFGAAIDGLARWSWS